MKTTKTAKGLRMHFLGPIELAYTIKGLGIFHAASVGSTPWVLNQTHFLSDPKTCWQHTVSNKTRGPTIKIVNIMPCGYAILPQIF